MTPNLCDSCPNEIGPYDGGLCGGCKDDEADRHAARRHHIELMDEVGQ